MNRNLNHRRITVEKFINQVWKIEKIRIIVYASKGTLVRSYDYKRASRESFTLAKLCAMRIDACLGGLKYDIVDGYGKYPVKQTHLDTVRNSYRTAEADKDAA